MSREPKFLTLAEIIDIHTDQIKRWGGEGGVRDIRLLESAIAQPEASFGGEWLHKDLFEMSSAYAFHICQNHPFIDGNKRAALASALIFLDINGAAIEDPKGKLQASMLALVDGKYGKMEFCKLLKNLSGKK